MSAVDQSRGDNAVPSRELAPGYVVPRLIKGGWQLAGGHGTVDRAQAIADMVAFAEAGITAFDCADIYTGVEELIGAFLRGWHERYGAAAPAIRVHTKCVPDRDALATLTRADVERLIDRSLTRLGVDALDLVQFHWWNFDVPGWLETAGHLAELQRAGKIRQLGVTNFDTPRLRVLLDAGIPIVSHQVQCSLLDRRALGAMATLCAERGVGLLTYGALAGGFFHERWLGAPEPQAPLENRSLMKYKLIIDEFGGWAAFQQLLHTLRGIADAHHTTIGAVALRAVLDEPAVTSVIVGARHADHLPATLAALSLEFTAAERAALHSVVAAAPGPRGDVYDLERDMTGVHAGIMRYNLNTA
ncbi:aldo/keto reductase [Gemmatimonas sp.]|uniref:aldo/keto reductase n=2 Tax=Gemmatimonas sp. TaxID=1962908 RepID=UPI003568FEB3